MPSPGAADARPPRLSAHPSARFLSNRIKKAPRAPLCELCSVDCSPPYSELNVLSNPIMNRLTLKQKLWVPLLLCWAALLIVTVVNAY
jgi:hypothetical protein